MQCLSRCSGGRAGRPASARPAGGPAQRVAQHATLRPLPAASPASSAPRRRVAASAEGRDRSRLQGAAGNGALAQPHARTARTQEHNTRSARRATHHNNTPHTYHATTAQSN